MSRDRVRSASRRATGLAFRAIVGFVAGIADTLNLGAGLHRPADAISLLDRDDSSCQLPPEVIRARDCQRTVWTDSCGWPVVHHAMASIEKMLGKMAKITPLAATLGEKHSRRMRGDDALSSMAALIFRKSVAKFADNFSMKRRSGGRQFKSTLLHHPVYRYSDISENRSKFARVRAICDRWRTWRAALFQRFAESGQFLSRRDLSRSAVLSFPSARSEMDS
jgi:hypothetical protein